MEPLMIKSKMSLLVARLENEGKVSTMPLNKSIKINEMVNCTMKQVRREFVKREHESRIAADKIILMAN